MSELFVRVCVDIYEGRLRSFAWLCADIYEGTTAASGLVKKLCGAIAKQYTSSHHDVFIRVFATDVQHFDMVPKFDMLITIFQHGKQILLILLSIYYALLVIKLAQKTSII